jgi:hypothetical protein
VLWEFGTNSVQLRERKNGSLAPKRHWMKHLDFFSFLLESKQSRSFAQIYAAHARRRLLDSLRTAAEWDHRGALTELERVRERTAAPLLQRTRFARPLSLSLKLHTDAQTGKGYTRTSAARTLCIAVFGAGDQKESWERALCA